VKRENEPQSTCSAGKLFRSANWIDYNWAVAKVLKNLLRVACRGAGRNSKKSL